MSVKGNKQDLKSFYTEKSPGPALEKNLVFVYYLQKIAKVQAIGVDHVYSCYKDVKAKVPENLKQSLLNTAFSKGWIDTKSMDNMTVTVPGENFVEHDLPKVKEKIEK